MDKINDVNGNTKVDSRRRYYVNPTRVVWSKSGDGQIENIENLVSDSRDCTTCRSVSGGTPSFILDFGRELNGGVCLELGDPKREWFADFRIRFGESVSEVLGQPNNDHCIHDVNLRMSAMGKHEFGNTGFRFIRVDLLSSNAVIDIRGIQAVALEMPLEYRGSFNCSDNLLNDIWATGARTVHLCCQDYVLDGIKRDRLLWVGDLHPQINVIANVFGDIDIVKKTLYKACENTQPGEWMNGHSSYSIWWIICVWDWFLYTGDVDWLKEQVGFLQRLVDQIISHVDENGKERLTGQRFLDWAIGFNDPVLDDGLQAITILGLQKALLLFKFLDVQGYTFKCETVIRLLRSAKMKPSTVKQVNSLRVLAGMIPAKEANENVLSVDDCNGLSTWFAYYALQARASAGDHIGSLNMIRKFWGGMLYLGATSFWEHFEMDWLENSTRIDEMPQADKLDVHADCGQHCFKGLRHSLCHGWAGGPTAWLSQHVLGVTPVEPGFKKVAINPNLGDLDFAKGTVPTPFGLITVEAFRKDSGDVEVSTQLPSGVKKVANKFVTSKTKELLCK